MILLSPQLVVEGSIPMAQSWTKKSDHLCTPALLSSSYLSLSKALITLRLGVLMYKHVDNNSTYF